MRLRRWIVVGCTIGATLALPPAAAADGGAYFDIRGGSGSGRGGSHFLPGDDAVGISYVSVPERWQELLDRGPFYVYVVPRGLIREGRPLPEGTIRVGTATIEHDSRTTFRIRTSFEVPDLPGDYYTVQMCNDPCTIAGFREPLTAEISIVQTTREAELLNERQRLWGQNYGLEREVRRANKANEELDASLEEAFDRMAALSAENSRLETELEAATAPDSSAPAGDARPLFEGWALVAIIVALLVGLGSVALVLLFIRRRGPTLVVPDTIAELDEDADTLAPR
jgi:hypothetical protein